MTWPFPIFDIISDVNSLKFFHWKKLAIFWLEICTHISWDIWREWWNQISCMVFSMIFPVLHWLQSCGQHHIIYLVSLQPVSAISHDFIAKFEPILKSQLLKWHDFIRPSALLLFVLVITFFSFESQFLAQTVRKAWKHKPSISQH